MLARICVLLKRLTLISGSCRCGERQMVVVPCQFARCSQCANERNLEGSCSAFAVGQRSHASSPLAQALNASNSGEFGRARRRRHSLSGRQNVCAVHAIDAQYTVHLQHPSRGPSKSFCTALVATTNIVDTYHSRLQHYLSVLFRVALSYNR